ncbi:hypothetical protein OEZ85_003189 [Tetradesmus obliquus]|uniref:CAP-Gly domain-containing protein n=1 Tax=Tetradesmus obliquus TaxID=3088 RepID=A0ABY8U2M0_TETOB|nr:hypothetical protein OEZ85_003189 [Tetradesmus obliquus]
MAAAYAPPTTISALKEYVSGSSTMQQSAESTVQLFITHNHLKARFPEIRLDQHMTVDAVKAKINSMTGTSVLSMTLHLQDEAGRLVDVLQEGSRKLGYYSPRDGWRLHVIDTDDSSLSAQGWLEDVSKVTKYVMSEEDYSSRDNTYRKFKEDKLRQDPTWTLEKEMCMRRGQPYTPPAQLGPDYMAAEAGSLSAGQRCCVEPGERRGEIKYVGRVEGLGEGFWVGVAFDEPLGKNDGSAKGKRYFSCPPGHGGFVRPDKVTAGDFPPVDEFASSDLGSEDEI